MGRTVRARSVETVAGNHCTYVPNKYYYDQFEDRWGKIVTKLVTDQNAAVAALRFRPARRRDLQRLEIRSSSRLGPASGS